jgi:metal-responsive CopG/Arc/MetJ family transcriptional regulator
MVKRAHLILPDELLDQVDRIAGPRRRSAFVEAAVREKLAREVLGSALREAAGILDLANYPEWETPEKVAAWVRAGRRADDARLARKLERPSA